jgi:hypothetical protein
MYNYLVFLLFSLLTACSSVSTGPLYSEETARSSTGVYVYRPHQALSGSGQDIFVDNHVAANLKDTGFVFIPLTPGKHVLGVLNPLDLSFHRPMVNYSFSIASHQVKYVKLFWYVDAGGVAQAAIANIFLPGAGAAAQGNTWKFVEVLPFNAKYAMQILHQSN